MSINPWFTITLLQALLTDVNNSESDMWAVRSTCYIWYGTVICGILLVGALRMEALVTYLWQGQSGHCLHYKC